MDDLLALSTDDVAEIRSMLVQVLATVPGDRVDATLETMAVLETVPAIRHIYPCCLHVVPGVARLRC